MSRAGTDRLKVNPPLGNLPALQYLLPAQLSIDATYQRNLETGPSQTLIRRIAMFWNWDLCQPLVVARRDDGSLYVIDGQHRLEAARLRGDIAQLPAVVVQYASQADEAASFVHLNQQRRPLSKLDVFKAAVASGDSEALAIGAAMAEAGLSVAPHSNYTTWQPGMVSNIGGIEAAWRVYGPVITTKAMMTLARAFKGQRLQFAGTIFPGLVAIHHSESVVKSARTIDDLLAMIGSRQQSEWRALVMRARADDPNLRYNNAVAKVFLDAWEKVSPAPAHPKAAPAPKVVLPSDPRASFAPPKPEVRDGKAWCDQCDRSISLSAATLCKSQFCKLRPRLSA